MQDADDITAEPIRRYGVVAVILRESRFLVIRRSQQVLAPGKYCFPGGGIESGETEPLALARELLEELNVPIVPQQCLWQSITPWRVALSWWLAELPPGVEPMPTPAEVESVHWLTAAEMAALPELLESNHHFLAAWRAGAFQLPIEPVV